MPRGQFERQPMSEETKRKISNTTMGRTKAPGRINGSPSEETKSKISQALMGNSNCEGKQNALGKSWTLSQETKERQKAARALRPLDDNPSYNAVHMWMSRNFHKTGACVACGEVRETYWANISSEYRREREDFVELCVPCHKLFDYQLRLQNADPQLLAKLVNLRLRNYSEV